VVSVPDLRTKALGYLRDEKVRVIEADTTKPELRPHRVSALVQGHFGRYLIVFKDGKWVCSCGSSEPCAHLAAVQMVTGWPSVASKQHAQAVSV
jgi:hypothetical protein